MNHVITQSIVDIFNRPADNNYDSMEDLLEVCQEDMEQSRTLNVRGSDMTFSVNDGAINLKIGGRSPLFVNTLLPLTHYSLTQVAKMAKIQPSMLERLHRKGRDDMVVSNLDVLFPNSRSQTKFVLVRDYKDGSASVARAVNGGIYARLWDHRMFSEVEDLLMPEGWTPKLPTLLKGGIRNGLMYGLNTGLFRGAQCSFGFFFADKQLEGNSDDLGGLKPGMMVWNSEVGARSFGYHTFYYHEASGSIMIWTPANHKRKRFVHRGASIEKAFREFLDTLEDVGENFQERYTDDLVTFRAAACTQFVYGSDDKTVERLNKHYKMSASSARAAVSASKLKQNTYGQAGSVWNIALGIAYEAGQTARAEVLVDDTLAATRLIQSVLKV